MPRRFSNTNLSPLQLRPLLRAALIPGERLIAWAVAHEHPPTSTAFLHMAITALPMVGLALSAAVAGPRRRLLLLTDQRLMVLSTDPRDFRRPNAAIVSETELGSLSVKVGSLGMSYQISSPLEPPLSIGIDPKQSRPAERLCFALTMMDPDRAEAVSRFLPSSEPPVSLDHLHSSRSVDSSADPDELPIFTDPQLEAETAANPVVTNRAFHRKTVRRSLS